LREASAFDGGKMFANGVDLGDGRTGMDKGAIGSDEVVEGNFVVDRFFGGCGTASAD
jgi:hypothetical protein